MPLLLPSGKPQLNMLCYETNSYQIVCSPWNLQQQQGQAACCTVIADAGQPSIYDGLLVRTHDDVCPLLSGGNVAVETGLYSPA